MAFVSFRLSKTDRHRLRNAVAKESCTLQEFMQKLVSNSLAVRHVPGKRLPEVVKNLQAHRDALADRHISHLWVFGSVARGEERANSDVDVIVEIAPDAKMSLTAFSRLQLDLSDLLGHPVDLAEWRTLRPHVTEEAKSDAVMVF